MNLKIELQTINDCIGKVVDFDIKPNERRADYGLECVYEFKSYSEYLTDILQIIFVLVPRQTL